MPTGGVKFWSCDPARLRLIFDVKEKESAAVEYLAGYLHDIGVKTILHEQVYFDRHYLDEFAEYYSRSFRQISAACQRLLFFVTEPDQTETAYLETFQTASTPRDRGVGALQMAFRGFTVIRPLENAGVGRTVLATYEGEPRRRYTSVRPYSVHIPSGSRLRVDGLAFQQQDMGAAVCASTALWSALQRVAFISGHRSPTPVQVTKAAESPFPASDGLDLRQMATALSNLGYDAEFFPVAESRQFFRACVSACLDSGLPAVLMLTRKRKTGAGEVEVGHAVAVSGYSRSAVSAEVPSPSEQGTPLKVRGAAVDVVYVHDDNLGPHAHYEIFDSEEANGNGHKRLMMRRGGTGKEGSWWVVDEWTVEGALVPKPTELRMAVASLVALMWRCRYIVEAIGKDLDPEYQPRVTTGIDYKRRVVEQNFGIDARIPLEELCLPRHVGVVTICAGEVDLFDFVIDVSETDRSGLPLLAIVAPGVPKLSLLWLQLRAVARHLECPLISKSL